MIYLTKGQTLFENPSMVVFESSGYYEDGSPVVCASAQLPDEPVCRFEAKFIAYGPQVYSIADEAILMEEVSKINPDSLFGKTKDEIEVDEMVSDIEMVDTADRTDSTPPVAVEPEVEPTNTPQVVPPMVDPVAASTVPIVDPSTSTTTPIIDVTLPEATTTPPIIPDVATTTIPVIMNASTTTPTLDDLLNASSTANEVVALVKKKAYKKLNLL
jgi:Flp pilus assembly CpaF family ATPase